MSHRVVVPVLVLLSLLQRPRSESCLNRHPVPIAAVTHCCYRIVVAVILSACSVITGLYRGRIVIVRGCLVCRAVRSISRRSPSCSTDYRVRVYREQVLHFLTLYTCY